MSLDIQGIVKLSTANGSVNVTGNISAGGGVEITAPNGGFMLNDSKGIYNVGGDPITMFTFGNQKVADALEKAIGMGVITKSWSNYIDYLEFIFGKLDNATKQETGSFTDEYTWIQNILSKYFLNNRSQEPHGSIVINGSISIVAKDINVNGLIQSGFANYNTQIDYNKISALNDKKFSIEDDVKENVKVPLIERRNIDLLRNSDALRKK